MVSEQKPALPPDAKSGGSDAAPSPVTSGTPLEPLGLAHSLAASADPIAAAAAAAAVGLADPNGALGDAFAALPFDESLMGGGSAPNTGGSFFIDTAMLAQQIAAVVADEKKLSDNIMDLMPPPVPIATSAAASVSAAATSGAMSLTTPLAPPPELMMRALSPPMSLLPELAQPLPVPPLSLDTKGASPASKAAAAPTKSEAAQQAAVAAAASVLLAATGATPTAASAPLASPPSLLDERRKQITSNHAALLKKRKSAEAFGDVKNEQSLAVPPAPPGAPTLNNLSAAASNAAAAAATNTNNANNSSALSAAAAVAAAAREKVMKEPQSGDLYECVITKRNGGLGLTLACVDDHVQITGLAPDTPAANSGICVGDTLVAVSGLPVRGLQFSTVIGRLKSTSRNSVVLKLRRNPFRQTAGGAAPYRGIKRPARPASKPPESNSANVLSSKSLALETRLGGGGSSVNGAAGNGSVTNGGDGDAHSHHHHLHHHHHHQAHGGHLSHLHMKVEPMNSSYFPTDASILTMGPALASGAAAAAAANANASANVNGNALAPPQASVVASATALPANADLQWKVSSEEKDRYFAECRALKHELASAMLSRRVEKRVADAYASQLQAVVDTFQRDMKALLTSSGPSSASAVSGGSNSNTNNEDLAALRQKLLEVNHALARQQTEILELKERETRHALPESQRVKWQIVMLIKKSMHELDLKALAAVAATTGLSPQLPSTSSSTSSSSSASSSPVPTLSSAAVSSALTKPVAEKEAGGGKPKQMFEERLEGVRPSVFELLFRQDMKVPAMATAPSIGLDLDAKACTQMLGWNLREVVTQANVAYVVSVENFVHVKYLRAEEAVVISWQFSVQALNY